MAKVWYKGVTVLFVAATAAGAINSTLPQPKLPTEGVQDVMPKPPDGTCPLGWTASGNFCFKSGSSAPIH
jgi:hypothetical protein